MKCFSLLRRLPLSGLLLIGLLGSPALDALATPGASGLVARRLLGTAPPRDLPQPGSDFSRDTLSTELRFDLATQRGLATITLAPSSSRAASFEVGDLEIERVADALGPLRFRVVEGSVVGRRRLEIGVPASPRPVTLEIAYRFRIHVDFDGLLPGGATFLWPYFCGNLFPCDPDLNDGFSFRVSVTGLAAGEVLVAPDEVSADAPPYAPAFAVGEYTYHRLGATSAGTEVGVWTVPGTENSARAAAARLPAIFEWYERTLGPYPFGPRVGTVVVEWPGGGFGGIEHHPYWHVSRSSVGDPLIHAHEAAHGWFGNGVRLRCWEDFVLSEGVATYLAVRGFEEVEGAAVGDAIWDRYRRQLEDAVQLGDTAAWPPSCNRIDILRHPIWSLIPYLKGAFFLRQVEEEIGREALDGALSAFYHQWVGQAAGMADLLETIRARTGFDPDPLADLWLRQPGLPLP